MTDQPSSFLFPFVFWVSLVITVLFRQYLWVISFSSLHNHNLVRVFDKPLFPLPPTTLNESYHSIFIHNLQISLSASTPNNTPIPDLSHLTQIGLIGTLERRSLTKIFPDFVLRDAQIVTFSTRPAGAQRLTYPLSNRLRSLADSFAFSLFSSLPSMEADLTAGILLGGNQRFSYQFRENIRRAGLLHLTAVSGYNITVLIGSAIVIFKLLGNRFLIIPGVIISIIFFALITGGGASVIRAALMGAIGFLALRAGSLRSTQRIFVLVALLMLLIKPAWAWDVGWELSTAATASLIWIAPFISKYLKSIKYLNPFYQELSASISAYLTTFPILVWRFGWNNISWVGIIANIPAAFLVPWIMGLGALVGFAGLLSLPLAQFIAILGRPPIWALVKIIEWGAKLNQMIAN